MRAGLREAADSDASAKRLQVLTSALHLQLMLIRDVLLFGGFFCSASKAALLSTRAKVFSRVWVAPATLRRYGRAAACLTVRIFDLQRSAVLTGMQEQSCFRQLQHGTFCKLLKPDEATTRSAGFVHAVHSSMNPDPPARRGIWN